MIVGGYTLDLYCDHKNKDHEYNEFPHTYYEQLGSLCRKNARRDGWILHKDGTATCPKCNPKHECVPEEDADPDLCDLPEIKRRVIEEKNDTTT